MFKDKDHVEKYNKYVCKSYTSYKSIVFDVITGEIISVITELDYIHCPNGDYKSFQEMKDNTSILDVTGDFLLKAKSKKNK